MLFCFQCFAWHASIHTSHTFTHQNCKPKMHTDRHTLLIHLHAHAQPHTVIHTASSFISTHIHTVTHSDTPNSYVFTQPRVYSELRKVSYLSVIVSLRHNHTKHVHTSAYKMNNHSRIIIVTHRRTVANTWHHCHTSTHVDVDASLFTDRKLCQPKAHSFAN